LPKEKVETKTYKTIHRKLKILHIKVAEYDMEYIVLFSERKFWRTSCEYGKFNKGCGMEMKTIY
jgi:hypothetical protein